MTAAPTQSGDSVEAPAEESGKPQIPTYLVYVGTNPTPTAINAATFTQISLGGEVVGELSCRRDERSLEVYYTYHELRDLESGAVTERLLLLGEVSAEFFGTNSFRLKLAPGKMEIVPIKD